MLPLIPEPLWGLMLSTNDCYPGCSCEAGRFEIDPPRVSRWVAEAGIEQGRQALSQLDALFAGPELLGLDPGDHLPGLIDQGVQLGVAADVEPPKPVEELREVRDARVPEDFRLAVLTPRKAFTHRPA